MNALRLEPRRSKTLVDDVEQALIRYFKENGLRPGDSIPNEKELSQSLGVGRPVLREALSRFKMIGMVVSRPKVGMVLEEPQLLGGMKMCINPFLMTDDTLRDIMELRVAMEIGISDYIFDNVTENDIRDLENIVEFSQMTGKNQYTPVSEHQFHAKLYEITGNRLICEFQSTIYPILDFVKTKYRDSFLPIEEELAERGELVTHADLLGYIKRGDRIGYKKAIEDHFKLYTLYLSRFRSSRAD